MAAIGQAPPARSGEIRGRGASRDHAKPTREKKTLGMPSDPSAAARKMVTVKASQPLTLATPAAATKPATAAQIKTLAEQYGIARSYVGVDGRERHISDRSVMALLRAMGVDAGDTTQAAAAIAAEKARSEWLDPIRVVRANEPVQLKLNLQPPGGAKGWTHKATTLIAEDGTRREVTPTLVAGPGGGLELSLPGQVEAGYYRVQVHLERAGGKQIRVEELVVVAPKTSLLPEEVIGRGHHGVGVGVDLFAVRSRDNLGVGDFRDLARLVDFGGAQDLAYLGLPPLHAVLSARGDASPYNPLSRMWLNPIHIDVTKTVRDYDSPAGRDILAKDSFTHEAERLRNQELVDFAGVSALKTPLLHNVYAELKANPTGKNAELWRQYEAYRAERGDDLLNFAGFVVLRETLAAQGINHLPPEYAGPTAPAFVEFVKTHHEAVAFTAWLQFETERQLGALSEKARALMPGGLYLDLAVGTAPDGYESWARPEMFLAGAGAGAPPDYFNPNGQSWGFPPFNPRALATPEGVLYFRDFVRANMRHAGVLRIDHAFGLRRLFTIPGGESAKHGAYLAMPEDVMLAVIALESTRNRTLVIGEDLGVAPPGWREKQAEQGMLGYDVIYADFLGRQHNRVQWPAPAGLRRMALATPTLHDTPPFRSLVEGAGAEAPDFVAPHLLLRRQLKLLESDHALTEAERSRRDAVRDLVDFLRRQGFLPEGGTPDRVAITRAMARYVGSAHSALKMWRLSDLGADPEVKSVNIPGVGAEYPSFRVKMQGSLEKVLTDPETAYLLKNLREAGGAHR